MLTSRRECGGNGSRGAAIAHDTPAPDGYTTAANAAMPQQSPADLSAPDCNRPQETSAPSMDYLLGGRQRLDGSTGGETQRAPQVLPDRRACGFGAVFRSLPMGIKRQ
jgi:hypothetical protein